MMRIHVRGKKIRMIRNKAKTRITGVEKPKGPPPTKRFTSLACQCLERDEDHQRFRRESDTRKQSKKGN